jgi:predicted RNA binding protein YcfA (HicA-like mRNA interferase family)
VKIPRDCGGADLAKALRRLGYVLDRQTGSHLILTTYESGEHHVTIPAHRPLKVGTLADILKEIARHHKMTVQELLEKLKL